MQLMLDKIVKEVTSGKDVDAATALWLLKDAPAEELFSAAHEITEKCAGKKFDTCSIINSKSGKCSENCKWCAQSAFFDTGVQCYPFVGTDECMRHAKYNKEQGIGRFSLVNSGKRASKKEIEQICETVRHIKQEVDIYICASLGLLDYEDLCRLHEAGVQRYHCNLETAPSHFSNLCTTHSIDQKVETLKNALRAGMEICSGGILAMGETPEQRVEFAFKLKELPLGSIPLNILHPIKGTPLEKLPAPAEEELLRTIAMFRFVHPKAYLRFAGGRDQLSRSGVEKSLYIGINAAIVGDLLTTIGSKSQEDFKMFRDAGYEL